MRNCTNWPIVHNCTCKFLCPASNYIHSFFFIRTSNFDAEAERSYIFWRFEAETFLKMFLNLPGIVFQPISADVTRQTIKEHFLLRYGIKLLAHTGLTCSDATCEMSRQPTLAKFGFKKRIDHRGLQQENKFTRFCGENAKKVHMQYMQQSFYQPTRVVCSCEVCSWCCSRREDPGKIIRLDAENRE